MSTPDGLRAKVRNLLEEIRALYTEDRTPWVVGYSGGKDSTAVLQLIWMALSTLPQSLRTKTVYVISTDTLVENPVVAAWVGTSHQRLRIAAARDKLPFQPRLLQPALQDRFWVNLIGRGYPAPRPKFRWCTERLKIRPSNRFILEVARKDGEVILVLGTRKAESSQRAARMSKAERVRLRERLTRNFSLPNSFVYTPIEDWSNDDVWMFLMQYPNPWGHSNKELLAMYRGATEGGECPLVVDTSTPSCGSSRFGCWVCTLVEKDKSMAAMIQNDNEKVWMTPLLELRDALDLPREQELPLRDFRRLKGSVQLYTKKDKSTGEQRDTFIPGPYTQEARAHWLRRLLKAQRWIRENRPQEVRDLDLISIEELEEIRRIWVEDKHEIEDLLPKIYEEVMNQPFPSTNPPASNRYFGDEEMKLLRHVCGQDDLHYQLVRALLDVEARHRMHFNRRGLFPELTKTLQQHAFDDVEEALRLAKLRKNARAAALNGDSHQIDHLFADETSAERNSR